MNRFTAVRLLALAFPILLAAPTLAAAPPAVEAEHGMVVSAQRLASEAGVEILKAGGNAVDAAVAVGFAEAVVNPCCGNIGGGGFMVLRLADGRERFINFRETAPAASSADMYLDAGGQPVREASLFGWKAAGVPGTVLGLDQALREYGKLTRARVMAPSIRLARDGFVLSQGDADLIAVVADRLARDPVAAKIFLHPDGSPLKVGERLVQKDLAATLQAISAGGPDAFYKGTPAQAVAAASAAGGGIMTAKDFAAYTVTEAAPLHCAYRGYDIISAPPPSSGGTTLCEVLGILEGYDLKSAGFHSAQSIHLMVEAMRHAYYDRNFFLGDPAFVENPLDRLLSKDYAASVRAQIQADKATPSDQIAPALADGNREKPETTHYSVVDKDGGAVSVTYTLNGLFGAAVMAPGTGFLLNNEMDDFTVKQGAPNMYGLIQGAKNAIQPGKRPLSSMAPTIVAKDGKSFLVLGSPGGPRIISIVLQVVTNVIDYGMSPAEAVDAPRIHHQWMPDKVAVEPWAISPDTARLLAGMGYQLVEQSPWGGAELIEIGRDAGGGPESSGNDRMVSGGVRAGMLYGAHDDRRPAGAAVGY